ncbi:MAG: D-aminoacyl-tRNA deacylase [Candidatus Hodarchaeota archaeon]
MNFLIITSSEDVASMNIRDKLLRSESYLFEEIGKKWKGNITLKLKKFPNDKGKNLLLKNNNIYLGLTDERMIFMNNLELEDTIRDPDFIIVASRHASKTARPALLTHTTGNWTKNADFGGQPEELSKSSAILHKAGFLSLLKEVEIELLENYVIDIEVTHHGPTNLEKPLIYMELGSSKKEWIDTVAAKVVANAIINTTFKYIEFRETQNNKVGIGFGGSHYAPNFNRIIRSSNIAISFICPKYFIQNLNHKFIEQMILNTYEKVDFFIIDWKGVNSEDKKYLFPILEQFEIPIRKTKDF